MIEALEADMVYRQRRHAERVGEWSRAAKVTAALGGALVALATVGSFILLVLHASGMTSP